MIAGLPRSLPSASAFLALFALGCCPRVTTPSGLTFVRTHDSDAWVNASIRVQARYARVLVVAESGHGPPRIPIRPVALNDRAALRRDATDGATQGVDATFTTLQAAVDAARGGDLVAVLPGRYPGFVIDERPETGDGRYVHVKAMGSVVIDRPAHADGDCWMILVRAAHHVVIEGFDIAGSAVQALPSSPHPSGPWAGIMLDGDFGRSGRLTHHVVVIDNVIHHHALWSLHSTDTHTVLLQGNLFALSAREHGAYVSDGSDDYVIRRNIFFGNHGAGLQCNLDPVASFNEVLSHPSFQGFPKDTTAAWARATLARADALFGVHNYPDGRGVNFIIEDNVMNENGVGGAAAINLAGLSDSLIQNNLIYGNHAHGIAQWNNDNPFDAELENPGPAQPADVRGPGSLPLFGCRNNVIRNNTVLMANGGRAAFQAVYGSFGSVVDNNVLINDEPTSVEVSGTGIYRLALGINVVNQVTYTRHADALRDLALVLPTADRGAIGITRSLRGGGRSLRRCAVARLRWAFFCAESRSARLPPPERLRPPSGSRQPGQSPCPGP